MATVGRKIRRATRSLDGFWRILLGLAVAALAVRLLMVFALPYPRPMFRVLGDGIYYYNAGRALAAGHGFVNGMNPDFPPHVLHPPLWTTTLGLLHYLGISSTAGQQVVASCIGAGTVVLTGLAGRRIASPRVGLWAAGLAALYPGLWLYERNLNAETITFPLIAAFLLYVYRFREDPTYENAALMGLCLGLLALTRSEQLLLSVLVVLPAALGTRHRRWQKPLIRLAVAGGVVVLVIAPWTLYNLPRFEQPVLLSAGSGNAMIAGACDETFAGPRIGSFDPTACSVGAEGYFEPDDTVRDAKLRQQAISYTIDNLGRYPVVLLAREGRSLGFFGFDQQAVQNESHVNAPAVASWAQTVMYWLLLPLGVLGILLLRRRHVAVYPLLAFPLLVVVSTAITFGDARYRAPAEIPLLIAAAVTIAALTTDRSDVVNVLRRRPAHPDPPTPGRGPQGAATRTPAAHR